MTTTTANNISSDEWRLNILFDYILISSLCTHVGANNCTCADNLTNFMDLYLGLRFGKTNNRNKSYRNVSPTMRMPWPSGLLPAHTWILSHRKIMLNISITCQLTSPIDCLGCECFLNNYRLLFFVTDSPKQISTCRQLLLFVRESARPSHSAGPKRRQMSCLVASVRRCEIRLTPQFCPTRTRRCHPRDDEMLFGHQESCGE